MLWNQEMWVLQISSFSGLFWLCEVIWDSIWILGLIFSLQKCHWDFDNNSIKYIGWFELYQHIERVAGRKATAAAAVKLLQSCPTLCGPIDSSLPGSSVPGILQTRILEWVQVWPNDYTVEVRNRFKGLDLIECLKNYGWRFVQEAKIKTIPKIKKCKMMVWGGLTNSWEKKRS